MNRVAQRVLVLLALFAVPVLAWAQCTMHVRTADIPSSGDEYTITWDPVPGAVKYAVIETDQPLDEFYTAPLTERFYGNGTTALFAHSVARDTSYGYIVRAYADHSYDPICAGATTVHVNGDGSIEDFVGRAIIPVVGSAPGAFGAKFKTYLRLEGSRSTPIRGRIIFHPVGQPASDDDPSLAYELKDQNAVLEWDDIVAAIGVSGIGSLDIVPEGTSIERPLPQIESRVYNDAPEGTFGASESAYLPKDIFGKEVIMQRFVIPDAQFRVNIGVRTFVPRTKAIVAVYDRDGKMRDSPPKTISFREPGFYMARPESFWYTPMEPGDRVAITWTDPVFPFHTLTENKTNDPFIFVVGQPTRGVVDLAGFRQ